MENENELVENQFACPKCGNRIMDDLVFIDDDLVLCTHCQTEYNPLEEAIK
jgi:hypothetical protein